MNFVAVELPADTRIFRSYEDPSRQTGYWYAFDASHTYGYGTHTAEFRTTRHLKMIDITHPTFFELLKKAVHEVAVTDPAVAADRHWLLFPFGFDDRTLYKDLLHHAGFVLSPSAFNPHVHMTSLLEFNNRSRLSIHEFDTALVKFLNTIVGDRYDGIISQKPFPDVLRNGMQLPELCVFDKSVVEFVEDLPRPATGGGDVMSSPYLPPLRCNEYGMVIPPTWKSYDEHVREVTNPVILPPVTTNTPRFQYFKAVEFPRFMEALESIKVPKTLLHMHMHISKTRKTRKLHRRARV
jgi:hypothetical protein